MHLRQLVLQVSDLRLVLLSLHLHLEQPDKPHNLSQGSTGTHTVGMHIHTAHLQLNSHMQMEAPVLGLNVSPTEHRG